MPSLQQLKYFMKTAENGSLNKAAKELFITQPALTKQLSLLEKELAVSLFIRHTNGIKITEAGQFLYDQLTLVLKTLDDIFIETQEIASQRAIRIGALPSLATHYMPMVLRSHSELRAKKIQLIVKDTTHELVRLLKEDEADLILVQDYVQEEGLASSMLFRETYQAIVPANHPLASQERVTLAELVQHPMVLYKSPCDIRSSFLRVCHEMNVKVSSFIDLEFNESILTFVESGLGVSIVPKMVADSIAAHPHIVVKALHAVDLEREIHVLWQPMVEEWIQQLPVGMKK
ncbi:LysR family transcriptional regulator [Brevibacillus migulae]|uniref:LysR family transcriptional regulator n=1 Tax=Brevibacillus migulae TaxID=1644114 RepID=UPI00142F8742|nr:LysR family transcriptional regulator [Brevibacillus migulae]